MQHQEKNVKMAFLTILVGRKKRWVLFSVCMCVWGGGGREASSHKYFQTTHFKRKELKSRRDINRLVELKIQLHTINLEICILWPLHPKWNFVIQKHAPGLTLSTDH